MITNLPPLLFFLSKILNEDNLIAGLTSYSQLADENLSEINPYDDPMRFVVVSDYKEKIDNFLAILVNERDRIKKAKKKSNRPTGTYGTGTKDEDLHPGTSKRAKKNR
jgi:hypothetical protein